MDIELGQNEPIIQNDSTSDISTDSIDPDIDHIYSEKMNNTLNQIRTQFSLSSHNSLSSNDYHESNSPLNSLSDNESTDEQFRKLSYQEIQQSLDKYYDDSDNKYSTELDILITYMKGQKNLFIHAYLLSQRKLNCIFIPTLLITCAITIFTPLIEQYQWNTAVISGLNAFTAMLISISNYLKLESSTQIFYNTATQFDKLENSLEFVASKFMFIQSEDEKSQIVYEKILEVEQKISEIKEWNSIFLPNEIRRTFPIICNINIFSFIKRMECNKKLLIAKFQDVKNEIRHIDHRKNTRHKERSRMNKRLEFLNNIKEKLRDELGHYRNAYSYIDELFTMEIQAAQNNRVMFQFFKTFSGFYTTNPCKEKTVSNPVVDKYLHFSCTN